MSDELLNSALTHGGTLVAGGGFTAWAVKKLFAGFEKRLGSIEKTLEESAKKSDERHESMIERMVKVESKADAAHRRLDEMPRRRK